MRHGLIFDLMGGKEGLADVRSKSVNRLSTKFGADAVHGLRVGKVSTALFDQLQPSDAKGESSQWHRQSRKLNWAAELHEIGSHISHSDCHKHGAYILDNADAMGFSLSELHTLSLLVLCHRGKLRKLNVDFEDSVFVQQLLALRLAVALCHARRDPDLSGLSLSRDAQNDHHFVLNCRPQWAQAFPQSAHLLREEVLAWQKTPWSLSVVGC